jgi:N-carbamoylputrescine amidase
MKGALFMSLKVTVCQMNTEREYFAQDWEQLVAHVSQQESQLVLLPEMPFAPWFATAPQFEEEAWQAAIQAHEHWLPRLSELAPAHVLSSRPVERGGGRFNEGFLWQPDSGYHAVHVKSYLPNEEGFWETNWYQHGAREFTTTTCQNAQLGMLICSELWALEQARAYGQRGAHLLVTPRATQGSTTEKWLVGGRAAAVLAGAFSLSSNGVSTGTASPALGGTGWVIDPEGEILAVTSREQPYVTVEIDLQQAEFAKKTYPRYLFGV